MSEYEKDSVTGAETTGHEWDGIKELNLPAPRWWLIMFIITVIWGVGYMVVYPAWPTLSGEGIRGGTEGSFGWTQYRELEESQREILERRAQYAGQFAAADYGQIQGDEALYAFAVTGGKSAFKDNCATCHGTGGAGGPGYPNLNDDDWLWGGTLADIEQTIRYGVRSNHYETRISEMPAFKDLLGDDEVAAIAGHVLSFSGGDGASELGAQLYDEQCALCHGGSGEGIAEMGAPRLNDAIWFYGAGEQAVINQIKAPKHGVMPAWTDRLNEQTIRQLTLYVHSLGGGQMAVVAEAEQPHDGLHHAPSLEGR